MYVFLCIIGAMVFAVAVTLAFNLNTTQAFLVGIPIGMVGGLLGGFLQASR